MNREEHILSLLHDFNSNLVCPKLFPLRSDEIKCHGNNIISNEQLPHRTAISNFLISQLKTWKTAKIGSV